MLKPWYARASNAGTQLVNMYGITETTVHVTYRPLHAADAQLVGVSPIGVRIPDLQLYVLDAQREPVPIGRGRRVVRRRRRRGARLSEPRRTDGRALRP